MTSLWHAVLSALLIAWLASSISWGAAGAAISSWGGRPIWLGAVISGLVPMFGALAITGWAASARRRRQLAIGAARAGMTVRPAGFARDPSIAGGPFGSGGGPFGSGGGPSDDQPSGRVERAGSSLPIDNTAPGPRERRWAMNVLFPVAAALLAVGFMLSLLSSDWADLSTNLHYGANIDAWDLGLGELLIVSALEFALFVPLSWRLRSRWPAVLAVFAGCWWGLLCWVAFSVTDGLQQLLDRSGMLDRAGGVAISAGWIWLPIASLAIGSVLWGAARLAYLHRTAAPGIVGGSA